MILPNSLFLVILFFILGNIFYIYFGLNILFFLLFFISIFLLLWFIYKKLIFSFIIASIFVLGSFYAYSFQKIYLDKNKNYLILEREIYSTNYKRFLSYYNDRLYIVYLPYYLEAKPKDKIYGEFEVVDNKIFFKKIEKIGKSSFSFIFSLKEKINEIIYKNYSLNSAELITGILYGEEIKDEEIRKLFKNTGLSHITAMSGFNLTIITSFVHIIFKNFFSSIILINFLSIIFVILFVIFTGFQSSIIRAAIMAIFLILAKGLGRIPHRRNILTLPLFLITIVNPFSLVNDLSFQLSFLGVAGILYLEEHIRKFLKIKVLSEIISAQIMVSPLIWYKFGEMNLFSFLINLIVLPVIPFLMFLGFIALIVFFIYPVNNMLNLPFEIFLNFIKIFSNIPIIYLNLPLIFIIFLYILILLFIYRLNKNEIDFNFKLY